MNSLKRTRNLRKFLATAQEIAPRHASVTSFCARREYSHRVALRGKEDYVIKSFLRDPVVSNTSVLERVWRDSAAFSKHIAIECAETRKRYTYDQLWTHTGRFATSIHRRLGLQTGDVIAAMLPNRPEFAIIMLGTMQAGCVLTTINPIYKEYEITHQLKLTEPKVIVTVQECYETVVKALDLIQLEVKIVIVDNINESVPEGVIKFSEVGESGPIDTKLLNSIERSKDDIAILPFSSGTTGLPKGVELTNHNIMAGLDMMQDERISLPKFATETFQDVVPCVLPFFHIYGLVVTLIGHLSKGCKLITIPKFTTNIFLDVMKNDKATILYVVPPIAIFLGKHADVKSEHLQTVRHLLCGAAPLAASDVEPILEKSKGNLAFCQGYGSTETTSLTTASIIGEIGDYSAAGVPLGGTEMLFVDPVTGDPVPIGEEGELLIRSPSVMRGYYKNVKATEESLTEDGFYRSGDLGYYKPKTGLFITDRIKELIKVKGMQVAPAELESLLRSHPAVQDAAVIGVPHAISGEVPKAFIIAKDGKKTNEEELQQFVARQVAVFKKIEEVQFIKEIPKTASGKILRRELKKMYA